MAIAIDPILSNVVYTINLAMPLRGPVASPYGKPEKEISEAKLPQVTVIRWSIVALILRFLSLSLDFIRSAFVFEWTWMVSQLMLLFSIAIYR